MKIAIDIGDVAVQKGTEYESEGVHAVEFMPDKVDVIKETQTRWTRTFLQFFLWCGKRKSDSRTF